MKRMDEVLAGTGLTEFGAVKPRPGLAYGIDASRKELYSLRQARYQSLGFELHRLAGEAAAASRRLSVLDIGVYNGVTYRYLEAWPNAVHVDLYGADLREQNVYRRDAWKGFWIGDLTAGYPEIPSSSFDVVICEQVLEHLADIDLAVPTLERLLRPGGTLIVGVPTFPHPLDLLRAPAIALIDGLQKNPRVRGHVRAFSKRSFCRMLTAKTGLRIEAVRGFRFISGGLLRPLEKRRSWWLLNRWLGEKVPGLATEIQVLARKPG